MCPLFLSGKGCASEHSKNNNRGQRAEKRCNWRDEMHKGRGSLFIGLLVAPMLVLAAGAFDAKPAPPLPLYPPSGSKGPSTEPVLIVDASNVASLYNFRLYVEGGPADPIAETWTDNNAWLPKSSSNPGGIGAGGLALGRYYWTCRVQQNGEWSDFFEPAWTFEIQIPEYDAPPEPPIPVAPPCGGKGPNPKPELVVDVPAMISLVHFQLYSVRNLDIPILDAYTMTNTWVPNPDNLPYGLVYGELPDGIYYWTACAYNGEAWSEFFSPMWYFEVGDNEPGACRIPPEPPVPVSPEQGGKHTNPNITLVVQAPAGLEQYNFKVTREADLGVPENVFDIYTPDPNVLLPFMPPLRFGIYRWTCRVSDGEMWSNWFAPEWTFELNQDPTDGVLGRNGVLGAVEVTPNPCGPTGTTLNLTITAPARVKAAIYSVDGQLVKTLAAPGLVNERQFRTTWDGTDDNGRTVGAGTYLCRIQTNDTRHVVKVTKSR